MLGLYCAQLKTTDPTQKSLGCRDGGEQQSVVCRRAWSFSHTQVVMGCLGGASSGLCAAGAHSQTQRGRGNLESCQGRSELL